MENNDIFGMLTADAAEMPSDKPKKPAEEKKPAAEKLAPEKKEDKKAAPPKKFKYPFQLYMGSHLKDVTGFFEDDKEYSGEEITKVMIGHDEYFFTGKIEYDYIPETNTVVAMSIQHKKG